MNEFIKKIVSQVKTVWGKLSLIQKLVLFGVTAAAVLGIVMLVSFSSSPSMVPLITAPITDQEKLQRVSSRLDSEGVEHT
ncbi:MAG: flagellar M-ring protein FliF, partial [Spirochaetaceae bacterium]